MRLSASQARLCAFAALAASGCTDGADDASSLAMALHDARPGDTVRIAAIRIEGSFVVGPGVSLVGEGAEDSVVVAPPGEPALRMTPGSRPTCARGLTVEADGSYAILAVGDGQVELDDVALHVPRGVGLGAEGLSSLSLSGVTIAGPVTSGSAEEEPLEPTPSETATHGIAAVRVATLEASDVVVTGFSLYGALFVDSRTHLLRVAFESNLGTGMVVHGGAAEIEQVEVCQTLRGLRLLPSYSVVLSGGATVATSDVTVCDGEGFGIVQSSATSVHTGLRVRNNASAAVWVQQSNGLQIGGGSTLDDNGLAGVVAIDSSGITIEDTTITGTTEVTRVVDAVSLRVGDGIQMLRSAASAAIRRVVLDNNARVGLLIDLSGGSSSEGLVVESVEVRGTEAQLGAVAQGDSIPQGWDDGVVRLGDTDTNDYEHLGNLDTVSAVSGDELPALGGVVEEGLDGIVIPSD